MWKSGYDTHSKLNKWVGIILQNRTGGHAQGKNQDIYFNGMKCQIHDSYLNPTKDSLKIGMSVRIAKAGGDS